jgi:hypothetical protein
MRNYSQEEHPYIHNLIEDNAEAHEVKPGYHSLDPGFVSEMNEGFDLVLELGERAG